MKPRRTSPMQYGRRLVTVAAVSVSLLGSVLAADPVLASTHSTKATLQRDVAAVHATGATAVLAEILDHGRSVRARAGVASLRSNRPVPFGGRFRTGSTTKTFVATVVLQLVGEGRLSLDDPVERWLPGVVAGNGYDGSTITVRQLLNHTSGIFDHTTDEAFVARLLASPFHHYSARALIDIALAHPPYFAPGTAFAYSSTNYIIAGEIIKAVTGRPWHKEVERRIIKPLHLRGTTAPGDDPTIPHPAVRGYNIFTSDPAERVYTDTTLYNMTWAGAAGSLITTTRDESRFYSALLSGRLLAPAQLAEMKKDAAVAPGVGLGIGHQTLSCGTEIWGHTGTVIGYSAYALATGDGSRSVVLAVATTTFSEQQYYDDSGNAAFALLMNVFCPDSAEDPSASRHAVSSVPLGPAWTVPHRLPAVIHG